MEERHKNCAEYLKKKEIHRIMQGLKKKYKSLGTVGGTFVIKDLSQKERMFLQNHFRQHFMGQKDIKINMTAFVKAFEGTIFQGVDFHQVLECYFGEAIVSNKDEKQERQKGIESYFAHEIDKRRIAEVGTWLKDICLGKGSDYKWLAALYRDSQKQLTSLLLALEDVLDVIEDQGLLLIPILAAKATKDPHALDGDQPLFKALLYFLSYKFGVAVPKSAIEKSEVLSRGGVLTNALNRSVLTYGLAGSRSGISLGWEKFYERHEPLSLLENNFRETKVWSKSHVVYCFENPSVFHYYINQRPHGAAICTNGQINITVYRLLEALVQANVNIAYNGDFDPEGLLIAEKLIQQFPDIRLIGYTERLYNKAKSRKPISETRLNQLKNVGNPKLETVKKLLLKQKKAGYQEYIMEELIHELAI